MGAPTTNPAPKSKPVTSSSSSSAAGEPPSSCATYLSLIQQYLAVFQVDNAAWLAERCVAEHPDSQEAAYLRALCHHRAGKPRNARHCLEQQPTAAAPTAAMLYLMAQCSYELGEYSRGETCLLNEAIAAYKQQQGRGGGGDATTAASSSSSISMDEWILQTTPCPIPNGAAGLALLGKICRKSNRRERAVKYFRMSLQLDPFLFSSFQSLAELGVKDLDAGAIFGGTVATPDQNSSVWGMMDNHNNNNNDNNATFPAMKTPLQPMDQSIASSAAATSIAIRNGGRTLAFETPGLTPIAASSDSTMLRQTPAAAKVQQPQPQQPQENPAVVRRARQVAARQYYPPSPETPVTSVTRSMRYLRGLGAAETQSSSNNNNAGRSLSAMSENQASNQVPVVAGPESTNAGAAAAAATDTVNLKPDNLKPDKESSDEKVQDILDLLSVSGAAYQSLCQYRCREALQIFQQLPVAQQRTAWVLHQQGRALLEQGDFLSAQRCLEHMHQQDPGRMAGLELLSTVYWQLKKEVALASLAQRAMDWDYESAEAHCVVGNCFSLQKDHETALVFFKRSLQLDPDFTYTHTLSGYEYMANEDFDKAIACFRQAMRTDERHYNAWYGLGAIYHRQEKYDFAEKHFEKAVEIHPSSSVLRCNLGMAQYANGKAYQALETLSEAFRLDPRNPQARFQRATIYSSLHRPEEALRELQIVRDAAPREATVHFAMGKVLKKLGRPDEAMKCFLTAMDLDPKDNQMIKSAMDKLDEADDNEESMANY